MMETYLLKKWKVILLLFLLVQTTGLLSENTSTKVLLAANQNQEQVIKGKVVDMHGNPLPSVTIMVKGTTEGTISDMNGNYSLKVPNAKGQLVFKFLGFITQELSYTGNSSINVTLDEDRKALDEVIVVSYGTQKKRDITGSMSKVKGDALGDIPVGQVGQKLQGQVAGVQVNQTTGKPGEGMSFRIRGASSINGSNQPLFVVDGFVLAADINKINPDEIETFTVLKDAAATSLYGSRAANGVILITTKKGKVGKTSVSFNAAYGIQTLNGTKQQDVMNARDFAQYKKEQWEDGMKYEGITDPVPAVYQNPDQYGAGTNWYETLTRTAPTQDYNLTITSGNEKLRTALMLGYFNQGGVLYNSGFERYTLRSNTDVTLNDRIKVGLSIAPSYQIANNHNTDGTWNVVGGAMCLSPILSPYNDDGSLKVALEAPGVYSFPNWLRVLKEDVNINKATTILSNMYADIDLWKGIKYKFQVGLNLGNSTNRAFTPSTSKGGFNWPPPNPATGSYNTDNYYDWTIENMLTYSKSIKEHKFDVLFGYTAEKNRVEKNTLNGSDYPDDAISWIDAAATTSGGASTTSYALLSTIGRLNYSFKDKYLFQAAVRRDGCSRFGTNNKYAYFPSVSAGWVISDEKFMIKTQKVMNYMKLRASYGSTGNYDIGNYTFIANMQNNNYVDGNSLVPGKSIAGIGNNSLTWETTNQLNIGFDFGFLDDRIFLMYDYYYKKTSSMLSSLEIPYSSGYETIQSNLGAYNSWGHEVTITSRNLIGAFKWKTDFNISFNRNKITKLGMNNTATGGTRDGEGFFNRLQVGEPIGVFYGYIFDGVYMTQEEFDNQPKMITSELGSTRYKDISGQDGKPDGKIDANDKTIIGNPNPNFIFGITNTFSYKSFDLSIFINGSQGNDVMNGNLGYTENLDWPAFNVSNSLKDRWRSLADPGNGIIPRSNVTGGAHSSANFRMNNSRWVEDGSFISIQNVTLGYTLPMKESSLISKVRFTLTGQHLFTFTKYSGVNPEVSKSWTGNSWEGLGTDLMNYPVAKTFTMGCNITF